jgi:hypothetical protein
MRWGTRTILSATHRPRRSYSCHSPIFRRRLVAELAALSGLIILPIHIYLTAKELKFPAPVATAFVTAAAVSTTMWMHYNFTVVQTSELIAFLYVLAWRDLRHRMDVRAGLLIGFAMTLKLFPGLMIFMLLAARRFRAFLVASSVFLASRCT